MGTQEAGERRPLRAWPVWTVLGVLLALGFLLLTQRWTHTGKAPPFAPPQMPNTTYGTGSTGPIPSAGDLRALAGQRVEFTSRVQEAAPSRAFWVSLQDGKRLLVLPLERDTPMEGVRAGEMITVAGRLQRPASQDVIVREWNLDPRTAMLLAREPVYLRADRIRPATGK